MAARERMFRCRNLAFKQKNEKIQRGTKMSGRDAQEKTIVIVSAITIIAMVILEILSKLIH